MVWVQPCTARETEGVGGGGLGSALNRTPKGKRSSLVLETSGRVKEKQQLLRKNQRSLCGGPPWQSSVKTPGFCCRSLDSIPGLGTKIPHARWCSQRKRFDFSKRAQKRNFITE